MNIKLITYRFLTIVGLVFALAACSGEGSMEKAGEEVDEFAQDAGNAIEDSCENVKEKLGAEDQDC